MRKIIISFTLLLATTTLPGQQHPGNQLASLISFVEKQHYQPRKIDSTLALQFFDSFLELADPGKLLFTKADVEQLSILKSRLVNDLGKGDTILYSKVKMLLKKKSSIVEGYLEKLLEKEFDFTKAEYYEAGKFRQWAEDDKELYNRWNQKLKMEVLKSLSGIGANQYKNTGKVDKQKVLTNEPSARALIKDKQQEQLKLFQSSANLDEWLMTVYMNAYLRIHDPHSMFMNESEAGDFKAGLNTESLSFGFSIDDNEQNEIVVDELQPGGPAWMSGEIHKGDILLAIEVAGKEKIDLSGSTSDEVNELLDELGVTKVTIVIRKANGKEQTVILQKQKLENDDNIVKSFIINGGNRKIGYISLPSFYTEWEDESGSSCAQDVAKEVVKLKKDQIEGLILDLRFNGGGSLMEALELAGIFIDEGALCLIKSKDGKVISLKDMNRGVIWNGPLLVMINGYSASASELIAATLQDYNRAILAGTRTHGKATSQEIMPFKKEGQSSHENFVKITKGKLYRTTGKTAQKDGVAPDIVLPDMYEAISEDEKDMPFALEADTISAYKYFKPLPSLQINQIKEASRKRVANDGRFQQITAAGEIFKQKIEREKISLLWSDVEKKIIENIKLYDRIDSIIYTPTILYKVVNNSTDNSLLTNPVAKEINERWLDRLARDVYVEECFQILGDLINLK